MARSVHKPQHIAPASAVRQLPSFQRREWLVQRVGWALMALIALAALAGLFGGGALASAVVTNSAARIEYRRLARMGTPLQWRVTPAHDAGGSVEVAIDSRLIANYRLTGINPAPTHARLEGHRWVFTFDAAGGAAPIVFELEASAMGTYQGEIQVGHTPPLGISQLVFP
jgi:hypothetical protein